MPSRAAVLLLMSTLLCAADPVAATALQVRLGLPNAADKLERGGPFTVAFIGGSITIGGGAEGYVALRFESSGSSGDFGEECVGCGAKPCSNSRTARRSRK